MTIVEGKEGLTIMDPLISTRNGQAALGLYYQHRPKPVVAVIYTRTATWTTTAACAAWWDEADVKAGKVKIYAPLGFLNTPWPRT